MRRLSRDPGQNTRAKGIPLGRYGTVKEIADATLYLFSDTGNYVTGSTVVGKCLWCAPDGPHIVFVLGNAFLSALLFLAS